jgi:hypothetical protein
MKKLLPLLLTTALAYCFTMPVLAEEATIKKSEIEETTPPDTSQEESELQGFEVRHQIGKGQISEGTQVKPEPLLLLHTLKEDVAQYLQQEGKPLDLKTIVTPIFAENLDKELKDIPSLTVDSFINEEGQGISKFDVPIYQHTVPEDENGGEVSINWKGLDGQFSYPETFETIKTDLTLQGLEIAETNAFSMKLGTLKFVADLDKDLLPIKIDANLPELTFQDMASTLSLSDLVLKSQSEKTTSGVEIGNGKFRLGQARYDIGQKTNSELKLLTLSFGGGEQNKIVSFTSNLSIENWSLSEAIAGETLEINHEMDAALSNLDASATAQLQQTIRELQNQLHSGQISEDILNFAMFGQLMQLAPQFLAKSPSFTLSNIRFNTNKGNLKGHLDLGINGQKAKSLNNIMELLMAITMQADFNIDKPLLKLALTATLGSEGQADTRIQALLKDKTLIETENSYTLSAMIVDNKLTLNGQDMGAPLDLFMLLMPLAIQ